jgi:hypothetical protein
MLIEGHGIGQRGHGGPEGLEKRAVTKSACFAIAPAHRGMAEQSTLCHKCQHRLLVVTLDALAPGHVLGDRVALLRRNRTVGGEATDPLPLAPVSLAPRDHLREWQAAASRSRSLPHPVFDVDPR